jgi:serpin B
MAGVKKEILMAAMAFLISGCWIQTPASLEEIYARALPFSHTPEKDALVQSINAFTIDLYARLAAAEKGNIFFAPFSVSSALAMTYAGAHGNTAMQMADSLCFTLGQAEIPAAFSALIGDIGAVGDRDGYELDIANSLWGQENFGFLPAFLAVLENSYGAPLREVDFMGQAEEAHGEINAWVAEQTHDKILNLLPAGSISSDTRLVLANAIYFKAMWARTFEAVRTTDQAFTLPDSTTVAVPMMHQSAEFRYMENELLQMLEMPYTTGDLSMCFILPQTGHDLGEVESALTADSFTEWISELDTAPGVDVGIPRFGFTASFTLAGQLSGLGMTDAFDPLAADFSGMTGSMGLFIGNVFHKAFVQVNEEGTEAAAATAVNVQLTAYPDLPSFIADRPFLFLIRHNLSGAILFFGRVTDPR